MNFIAASIVALSLAVLSLPNVGFAQMRGVPPTSAAAPRVRAVDAGIAIADSGSIEDTAIAGADAGVSRVTAATASATDSGVILGAADASSAVGDAADQDAAAANATTTVSANATATATSVSAGATDANVLAPAPPPTGTPNGTPPSTSVSNAHAPAHGAGAHAAPRGRPANVRAELGRGVIFTTDDRAFELNIRARMQAQFALTTFPPPAAGMAQRDPATDFQIRRARLLFQGHVFSRDWQYYIQLGFSNRDTEPDLRLPLRDAYLTFTRVRDLNIRLGQMKVPFDRQRVVSSSSLQFVDRSIVVGELNLDRDVGLQFLSTDLFGLGHRLGYQIGVFGGDGRNRFAGNFGLLYVARIQVNPFGRFEDYVEGDHERTSQPRLAIAAGVAFNHNTNRPQSTIANPYTFSRFSYLHFEADTIFKVAGFSMMAEFLYRSATDGAYRESTAMMGMMPMREYSRNFWGYFVQAALMVTRHLEFGARFGDLRPIVLDPMNVDAAQRVQRELGGVASWYFAQHALKIQADYFFLFGDSFDDRPVHQMRIQAQLFF